MRSGAVARAKDDPAPEPPARDVLQTILDELRALRADVAALLEQRRARDLDREDAALLAALLVPGFAAFTSAEFTVRDLREFADEVAGQEALRAALDAIGDTRSVGRLLKRCEGGTAADLMLRYVRPSPEGHVWQVEKAQ